MSIASEITRLQTAKAGIKTSIENKGVTVPSNAKLDDYSNLIDTISGGGGIDWSEIGYSTTPKTISDGFNYATTIYNNWDSTQTSYNSKFLNDKSLFIMPLVNTSNGTNFNKMFSYCTSLIEIPQINTSNGTNFSNMFSYCTSLQVVPQINTSNGTNFNYMFTDNSNLKTIPELNASKATTLTYCFSNCSKLETLGGLLNVGQAFLTTVAANSSNYRIYLPSTYLTHDSLMNVINKLYDIATKGCNTQKLEIGSSNLAKLTSSEIATATNKGWTVS